MVPSSGYKEVCLQIRGGFKPSSERAMIATTMEPKCCLVAGYISHHYAALSLAQSLSVSCGTITNAVSLASVIIDRLVSDRGDTALR